MLTFHGSRRTCAVTLKNFMGELFDTGGAVFFSTHVLDVAEKLCNKAAIINDLILSLLIMLPEIIVYGICNKL